LLNSPDFNKIDMGVGLYEQMLNEKLIQSNIQSAKSVERDSFYSDNGIKQNETKHNYNFK